MAVKQLGAYPANSTDAASKQYVDDFQSGENFKLPCSFATAGAALPFGPAVYASAGNGGVGDTLTAASNGILTFDGGTPWTAVSQTITNVTNSGTTVTFTVASTTGMAVGQPVTIAGVTGFTTNNPNGNFTVNTAGSSTSFTVIVNNAPTGTYSSGGTVVGQACRILVKNEATTSRNGIYVVTNKGAASGKYVLTRSTDMDSATVTNTGLQKYNGAVVHVEGGTTNAGTGWALNITGGVTPGTTSLSWTQVYGVGVYTAGNGITNTSGSFSVAPLTNGGITVAAGGVSVTAGNGIAVGSGGVVVTPATNGGLSVGAGGVAVVAPSTFTPFSATTGFAIGAGGSQNGYFVRAGNLCWIHAELVVGSGTNLGSSGVILTLPVAAATYAILQGTWKSAALSNHPLYAYTQSSGTATCTVTWARTGTLASGVDNDALLTNTSPEAIATGDFMVISGWYKI